MRRAWAALIAMLATAASIATAGVATASAPAPIPVAWQATGAAAFNAPALTPNGVVTTADNVATARALQHGVMLWRKTIADEMGLHIALGPPTVSGGVVDAVMYTAYGDGVADFATSNGKPTLTGPTPHMLLGPLVVNGAQSVRVTGAYGSNAGPWYSIAFGGGNPWFVDYGPAYIGLPALIDGRVFVVVDELLEAFDPAQGCKPLPIPNPPPLCAPTWMTARLGGQPHTPSPGAPGHILISATSGVVRSIDASTGAITWTSGNFATVIGPTTTSNGLVYFGGEDGVVRALDATTGKIRWKGDAGGVIDSAPTVSGGRVYVATNNGRLVAFAATGCGARSCPAIGVGDAHLPGTTAAGAPVVRNHRAVAAYGSHLVAFSV